MSTPIVEPCRCSHTQADHCLLGLAPQCAARGCTCLRYRPEAQPATAPAAGTGRPATFPPGATVTALPQPAPRPAREPEIAVRGERGPTVEQILAAGKRSGFKRTVQLTERIALMIHDLGGRLADEREHAEQRRQDEAERAAAQAEVDRLERQLAAARARIKGKAPAPAVAAVPASVACRREGCDQSFTSSQGRALHERRAHDGFNPKSAQVPDARS